MTLVTTRAFRVPSGIAPRRCLVLTPWTEIQWVAVPPSPGTRGMVLRIGVRTGNTFLAGVWRSYQTRPRLVVTPVVSTALPIGDVTLFAISFLVAASKVAIVSLENCCIFGNTVHLVEVGPG